jgi:hypothetical protein
MSAFDTRAVSAEMFFGDVVLLTLSVLMSESHTAPMKLIPADRPSCIDYTMVSAELNPQRGPLCPGIDLPRFNKLGPYQGAMERQ